MRQAQVTFHAQGPQSGARVQIHDQPPMLPGSSHNRLDVTGAEESVTYARNDGMKTRVTISKGPTMYVGQTEVKMPAERVRLDDNRPDTIEAMIEALQAKAERERQAIADAEETYQNTLAAIDRAYHQIEAQRDELSAAEIRAERERSRTLESVQAERDELARERQRLADERELLEADRLELEAVRAGLELDGPQTTPPPPSEAAG